MSDTLTYLIKQVVNTRNAISTSSTLQDDDARIIIAVMYEDKARETLCAVGYACYIVKWVLYMFFKVAKCF